MASFTSALWREKSVALDGPWPHNRRYVEQTGIWSQAQQSHG